MKYQKIQDPLAAYLAYFFTLPMFAFALVQHFTGIDMASLFFLSTFVPLISLVTLPLEKFIEKDSTKMCFWWPYLEQKQ